MIEFLFLDLDDTILDFQKAEAIALKKTLREFGMEPTDRICALYSRINREHWQRLERKELTRAQVLVGRFRELFRAEGIGAEPEQVALSYENHLSQGHYFLPGAQEALETLSKSFRLFLASNGTKKVQDGRLDSADIRHYFEGIFVSQEIGADKPSREYFDRCTASIPGYCSQRAMMVGDSLTSDILGGRQAGMQTCWINPGHAPSRADIPADFELEALSQLPALLEKL